MDPQMMAQGGTQPQTQISPGSTTTADPQKLIEALKGAIQQSVDQQGYVDINRLVQIWPQIAQKLGINIPFQTVVQLIQQNPSILENIITEMGLAGIIKNGQRMSAEQILGSGTGATGQPSQPMMGG